MFRTVRFIIRVVLGLLIALLVLAFFTNPTMEDFKVEAKKQFDEMLKPQTDNPALSYIASMSSDFTDQIVDKMVVRKNYYICSIYTVSMPDGDYQILGAYHLFYPIGDKDLFEMAKMKFDRLKN